MHQPRLGDTAQVTHLLNHVLEIILSEHICGAESTVLRCGKTSLVSISVHQSAISQWY